jgi:FkbM family methyltransferase
VTTFLDSLGLFGIKPKGVIHVGAARGEEYDLYQSHGITWQVWIEPQPDLYLDLQCKVRWSTFVKTFNVACGSRAGKFAMYRLKGNKGHSNSLMRPKRHLELHPDNVIESATMVDAVRLDDLLLNFDLEAAPHDLMVVDVQGYELEVLNGGERAVSRMKAVFCEVNAEEMYEGCPLVGEIDDWMDKHGLSRRWTDWCGPEKSYGDAIYVRGT